MKMVLCYWPYQHTIQALSARDLFGVGELDPQFASYFPRLTLIFISHVRLVPYYVERK